VIFFRFLGLTPQAIACRPSGAEILWTCQLIEHFHLWIAQLQKPEHPLPKISHRVVLRTLSHPLRRGVTLLSAAVSKYGKINLPPQNKIDPQEGTLKKIAASESSLLRGIGA
jgi:hypothetical protein